MKALVRRTQSRYFGLVSPSLLSSKVTPETLTISRFISRGLTSDQDDAGVASAKKPKALS